MLLESLKQFDWMNEPFNVRFDDNKVSEYSLSDIDQIIPAYAVSVHKSQGSEFKAVVVALSQGNYFIMTRNLLYTAVTCYHYFAQCGQVFLQCHTDILAVPCDGFSHVTDTGDFQLYSFSHLGEAEVSVKVSDRTR